MDHLSGWDPARSARPSPGAPSLLQGGATPLGFAAALILGSALTLGASAPGPGDRSAPDTAGTPGQQQVILITGSTDGLGREVALEMAGPGVHILVHGRNEERGLAVVQEIEAAGGSARFHRADLADLDEVRALADAVLRENERLDVLVNNAGIWLPTEQGRQVNDAGHELHFAVNYLSHYLLTHNLLPLLRESAPARIINVASVAQRPLDFDDVMLEAGYSDGGAYAQSKLAQILFTFDLARELEGSGVTVNALHPATMMNTTMVLSRGATARADVGEGVEAVVQQIRTADPGTGQYFNGLEATRANDQAYDADALRRLRELSRELTGTP